MIVGMMVMGIPINLQKNTKNNTTLRFDPFRRNPNQKNPVSLSLNPSTQSQVLAGFPDGMPVNAASRLQVVRSASRLEENSKLKQPVPRLRR